MSEPHETWEAADSRIAKFFDELYALREKYQLCDMLVVIGDSYVDAEAKECAFVTSFNIGDWMREESLAAYAYGKAKADKTTLIGNLLTGKHRED